MKFIPPVPGECPRRDLQDLPQTLSLLQQAEETPGACISALSFTKLQEKTAAAAVLETVLLREGLWVWSGGVQRSCHCFTCSSLLDPNV